MLDGLEYVVVEIAAVALLAALLGGALGWLGGRVSLHRGITDKRSTRASAAAAARDEAEQALAQQSAELKDLREELERKDLELTRLETGAVTAWDRTVPQLEETVATLKREHAEMSTQLSQTTQALDLAGGELERLRGAVAERDQQLSGARDDQDGE